ncbi:MAG: glycosyltransferase family 4 protein [Deltaproteobacteria bacterium]|nr:glycosyltransferase family 4 protein [Deltaproteobacteria bacterium]
MRLAVFCSILSPWSRQAVLRLVELGNEVHVIDFSTQGQHDYLHERSEVFGRDIAYMRRRIAGVHLIRNASGSRLRYIVYARKLGRICRDIDADVLLTLWGGGWAVMSYLSGFRPYAVFVGGGDILRVSGWQKLVSHYALTEARVVFANGQYFAERTRAFAPKANVVPLYYGVDPDRFKPIDSSADYLRIVCTRGFSEVYNNGYLIEGMANLDKEIQNIEVVFTSPGRLLAETMEKADRLLPAEIRDRVMFRNGVTDDEMLDILQNSNIYVSLSRYDGTSISLLEALSCGLFPVLSDIPQNREWVNPLRENGLLVPLDSPADLSEALAKAIRSVELRHRARAANRGLILERADGRKNMQILTSKLESFIS